MLRTIYKSSVGRQSRGPIEEEIGVSWKAVDVMDSRMLIIEVEMWSGRQLSRSMSISGVRSSIPIASSASAAASASRSDRNSFDIGLLVSSC